MTPLAIAPLLAGTALAGAPLPMQPALYVVATPLGNLRDITLRALEVLHGADCIAAEDTRHSQKLLDAYGIEAKLFALHEHNEQQAADHLLRQLQAGARVALISDAGTPGISDPGARAVARVRAAGFTVIPVPGASAVTAALSVAGFTAAHFHFVGFLPAKTGARRNALTPLRDLDAVLVFYEAPHRIEEMLADLCAVFPEPGREILLARELTKQFEESARMPLQEAPAWLAADPYRERGEYVVLLSPPATRGTTTARAEDILRRLLDELPLKTAVRLAAEFSGVSKNALYDLALSWRKPEDPASAEPEIESTPPAIQ